MYNPGAINNFPVDTYRKTFFYVFEGARAFEYTSTPHGVLAEKEIAGIEVNIHDLSGNRTLVNFDTGDSITVQAGEEGVRFLLISGKPIEEPVAWHGTIVINTRAELKQAVKDLQNRTFIKAAH